jgi:DNA sulfur modification protein DndD
VIVNEIILQNVGLFRGIQRAVLAPPSPSKPITLFGGLNGTGKTTLLESMQLALYGKLANTGRRNGLSYDDYLRRLINRGAGPKEGAMVEISVRVNEEGQAKTLRIRRAWRANDARVAEILEVYCDGQLDPVLSDTWPEHVSRYLPAQLSNLFFFDGERVEELADPERSSDVLLTAVNALLGVDLVQQLQVDLMALDRRKLAEKRSEPERERLAEAERQLAAVIDRIGCAKQDSSQLRGQRDFCSKKLNRVEQEFIRQGGVLAENRKELEQKRAQLVKEFESIHRKIADLAASDLPLALIPSLLAAICNQAKIERRAEIDRLTHKELQRHDKDIITAIKKIIRDNKTRIAVRKWLENRQRHRKIPMKGTSFLELPEKGYTRLEAIITSGLDDVRRRMSGLLNELCQNQYQIERADRQLATVPDADAVAKIMKERDELRRQVAEQDVRIEVMEEREQQMRREKTTLEQVIASFAGDSASIRLGNDDIQRFLRHSDRARQTLEKFRVTITQKHTRRLEVLILEGFRQLLRKQELVHDIRIDAGTCQLQLFGTSGDRLPPERLSAGERQLLAVSILWGLARASGRPLPIVVDTPLGRLDASHRSHLVERYFPLASHQVILLSTDEEIRGNCLEILRPSIGNFYRLSYDEVVGGTTIEPGYFETEAMQ